MLVRWGQVGVESRATVEALRLMPGCTISTEAATTVFSNRFTGKSARLESGLPPYLLDGLTVGADAEELVRLAQRAGWKPEVFLGVLGELVERGIVG